MNLSYRHAIFSAILSAEATATFMFLPSLYGSMITRPYQNLLTAYPHLCDNSGTIPANEVTYTSSYHSRVWNTAARIHLNSHNPAWLQNLARDIPGANSHLENLLNDLEHY